MDFTHNGKDYISSIEVKDDYITISISTDGAICGHITFRYYSNTLGISYINCTCLKGICLSKLMELMFLYSTRFDINQDTAVELFVEPDNIGGDVKKLTAHYKKSGFVSDPELPAFMTSTVKTISDKFKAKGKRKARKTKKSRKSRKK